MNATRDVMCLAARALESHTAADTVTAAVASCRRSVRLSGDPKALGQILSRRAWITVRLSQPRGPHS